MAKMTEAQLNEQLAQKLPGFRLADPEVWSDTVQEPVHAEANTPEMEYLREKYGSDATQAPNTYSTGGTRSTVAALAAETDGGEPASADADDSTGRMYDPGEDEIILAGGGSDSLDYVDDSDDDELILLQSKSSGQDSANDAGEKVAVASKGRITGVQG
ncbi:MAG TPA: hypothetical protein VF826_03100 [Chloroflexia bacterium]|jgi:hypothetical protein